LKTKIKFKKWKCVLEFGQYGNGRIAITLNDAVDGSPVAKATVNLADVPLPDNHVLIKDWSENEGMLNCLEENGIVKSTGKTHSTGFVSAHECELLVDP